MSADDKKPKSEEKPKVDPKPKAEEKPKTATQLKADPQQVHMTVVLKHARPLTACRFDPTGKFVFSGAEDNTIQRWTVADAKPSADGKSPSEAKMTSFEAHDSWVRAIGFSLDGQTMFTGGYDGRLIFWPTAADKPTPTKKIDAHNGWIRAIAVSGDGKLIATCGNDNLVKLWSAADGKLVRELKGHENHVYNVAFHPDGKSLVSCDLKAKYKHWELASGKLLRDFATEDLYKYDTGFRADIGGARSLAFSLDGKLLGAGGITKVTNAFAGIGNPAVAEIDWESGKLKVLHTGKEAVSGVIWGLAQHVDGFWVGISGTRSGGGGLYFWKPGEVNEFFRFAPPAVGRDMAMHPDGVQLAIAHADGNLRLYRMAKKV